MRRTRCRFALAVMSATIWRTWTFRLSAIPLLLVGIVGATQGPRYDVMSRRPATWRRFATPTARSRWWASASTPSPPSNGLALTATGAIPLRPAPSTRLAAAWAASPLCRGGIALHRRRQLAFDEDCGRAEVGSARSARPRRKPKFLFDEQALARLGAVGLTWSNSGFAMATGRSPLENRPWSPAPAAPRDDRIVRPGHGARTAPTRPTPANEPEEGK